MAWQRVIARLDRDKVPEAEALLELAGAVSISLEDAADLPLFEPLPGTTPLWPDVVVKALFDSSADAKRVKALLERTLGENVPLAIEPVAEDDLAKRGLGELEPLRIGAGLWVISADDEAPTDGTAFVRLRRGLAFGTGEHPTTALCLKWIESSLSPGSVVLDYGCGSGVLALAALRLGASRAFAIDNDPQAVAATAANASLNGLSHRLWVGAPEALPAFRADVVLANILARPLIALAADFANRVVTGGQVVLSGLLSAQRAEVEDAYRPHFAIGAAAEQDGWIRLEARRRAAFEQCDARASH